MRAYSDKEVAEYLGGWGIPLDAYCLVGEPGHELPVCWLAEVGFRYLIIETAGLDQAAIAFLTGRGATRFPDTAAVFHAAHAERWPGWERYAPVDPWAKPAEPVAAT